jgi:hypothetical protein
MTLSRDITEALGTDDWLIVSAARPLGEDLITADHLDEAHRSAHDRLHAPCGEELHSWDYFRPEQVDSYWMRCDLTGQHLEHENSDTGAHWSTLPAGRDEPRSPEPVADRVVTTKGPRRTGTVLERRSAGRLVVDWDDGLTSGCSDQVVTGVA